MTKKYAADYRLENCLDKRGRLVTMPVYTGKYYFFDADADTLKKALIISCACVAVVTTCEAFSLLINSQLVHFPFINVPLVFCLIPAGFVLASISAAIGVMKNSLGATREQSDKIYSRFAISSFFALLLSLFSFFSGIIALIMRTVKVQQTDVFVYILLAVQTAATVALFMQRNKYKMQTKD